MIRYLLCPLLLLPSLLFIQCSSADLTGKNQYFGFHNRTEIPEAKDESDSTIPSYAQTDTEVSTEDRNDAAHSPHPTPQYDTTIIITKESTTSSKKIYIVEEPDVVYVPVVVPWWDYIRYEWYVDRCYRRYSRRTVIFVYWYIYDPIIWIHPISRCLPYWYAVCSPRPYYHKYHNIYWESPHYINSPSPSRYSTPTLQVRKTSQEAPPVGKQETYPIILENTAQTTAKIDKIEEVKQPDNLSIKRIPRQQSEEVPAHSPSTEKQKPQQTAPPIELQPQPKTIPQNREVRNTGKSQKPKRSTSIPFIEISKIIGKALLNSGEKIEKQQKNFTGVKHDQQSSAPKAQFQSSFPKNSKTQTEAIPTRIRHSTKSEEK